MMASQQQRYIIDRRLTLDLDRQFALLDGKHVHLSPTETRILQSLCSPPGRTVSYEALLREVWQTRRRKGSVKSLWVHVCRLRRKLEDDPDDPYYIQTVRERGYYLCSDSDIVSR